MNAMFRQVQDVLSTCKKTTRVTRGGKHYKVFVGKRLAGIFNPCHRGADPRAILNMVSQIRRLDRA